MSRRTSEETERLLGSTDPPPTQYSHLSLGKSNRVTNCQPQCTDKPSLFQIPSKEWLLRHIDQDAILFGIRMSVCLTVSSLFVLVQVPSDGEVGRFPEGMWVLITVLFVCWFPTMDAASVLEKSFQRLMGTLVGAGIGMACGFLSVEVKKAYGIRAQAICLGSCIALVSFTGCSYAVHKRAGRASLVETKNYATILCLLTFIICLMPFYSMSDKQWHKSMYRVMNVIIGCFLGVGLSMMVFPRPTLTILQDKISKQIELVGEASEAVLHTAAEIFSEETYIPLSLADEIIGRGSVRMRTPSIQRTWRKTASDYDYGHDVVLEKYEAATKEWRAAKAQLGMLKYDPFNIGLPDDLLQTFRNEVAQILARAMRIQTTMVLIDGIVRNDPKHKFSEEHLELLANVGTLIRSMLSVPLDVTTSDVTAKQLSVNLVAMRRMIVDLSAAVSTSPELQMYGSSSGLPSLLEGEVDDDRGGTGYPKHVQGSHVCSLLFLQLVEHLALRSVRLYQSWKQYDGVCRTAENLKASVRGKVPKEVLEGQPV